MSFRPLHIGLSAHLLSLAGTYRSAGANRYIHGLLSSLPLVDGDIRYTAFLGERRARFPGLTLRLSRLPTYRPPVRILWEQLVQPLALVREGIDLLHALAFVSPLLSPCPVVVTVYDLSFVLLPHSFPKVKRLYLSLFTPLSVKRARRIIAVSRNTRNDLMRLWNISPEKIDVIYCGVDSSLRPLEREKVSRFRRERGLPERFILYLGTLEPRKNLVRLLEAYARLPAESRPHLVMAGAKGWGYEAIGARVEELGLEGQVLFPGYIPQEEKALWYNAAEILVYPSLYEGFGLPPLEAMACGTPVVASCRASLPEVVGEAGVLVDPLDTEAMAQAMHDLLEDQTWRESLRDKGLKRARQFSWEKAARETVRVYRRALRESQK